MSTKNHKGDFVASSESTGGGGFAFEWRMQAFFAVLMLCDAELAVLPGKKIIRIEFQTRHKNCALDDTRLVLVDDSGKESQALVQIKESLTFAPTNDDFRETVEAAWSDFTDKELFKKNVDVCLMVTGPLSAKDRNSLERLCNHARTRRFEIVDKELQENIGFSSGQTELYSRIKKIVCEKYGQVVDETTFAGFLAHIYPLQPDSLFGNGLLESYVYALLKRHFEGASPRLLFDSIIKKMSDRDRTRGEWSKEQLVKELATGCVTVKCTPNEENNVAVVKADDGSEDVKHKPNSLQTDNEHKQPIPTKVLVSNKNDLALLSLIGSWNETVDADKRLLCAVLSCDEESLDRKLYEFADMDLIASQDGVSHIAQRRKMWRATAKTISKQSINRFIVCAKKELSRIDMALDVPSQERFMSGDSNRDEFASTILREGIARGIAMLAVDYKYCTRVSASERASIGWKFTRSLLWNVDWRTWATLDEDIRYIAEVSPDEFLDCLRKFLRKKKNGLDVLYSQDDGTFTSRTYIVGILDALVSLAWIPSLIGEAINILVEMVRRDTGGQWHPRPIDKLRYILHPISPHTWASETRRVSIIKGVLRRIDDATAWRIVEALLPAEHYSFLAASTGPIFRANGRTEELPKRTYKQLWDEYSAYCTMAVGLLGIKRERLGKLINAAIECWPNVSFDELVSYVKNIKPRLDKEVCFEVWSSLRNAIYYGRLHSKGDAEKSWRVRRIKAYGDLETLYKPDDIMYRSRVLFSWRDELYDKELNDLSDEDIRKQQEVAVSDMWRKYGSDETLAFACKTDKPELVGHLLGLICGQYDDNKLLPKYLTAAESDFYPAIAGYVTGRFKGNSWKWVDSLGFAQWNPDATATLLVMLPFRKDVWMRLDAMLGKDKSLYWSKIIHPYVATEADVHDAVEGLLSVGCGYKALDIVAHYVILNRGEVLDEARQIMKAFVEGRVKDAPKSITYHNIGEVITLIQASEAVPDEEKAQIEWMFIDLVDWQGGHGFKASALCAKLARDADFFCEAVRTVYLPEKQAKKIKEERENNPLPDKEQHRIENVWKLLEYGLIPPGFNKEGAFNPDEFIRWTRRVLSVGRKEDRLSSTKGVLGRMFFAAVGKGGDFWLPHEMAALMEKKGNDRMLRSFGVAMFNSRGVHDFDKTGKEDSELAAKYETMAEEAEGFGYNGLAREVRRVAKFIKQDWERTHNEDKSLDACFDASKEDKDQSRLESSDDE